MDWQLLQVYTQRWAIEMMKGWGIGALYRGKMAGDRLALVGCGGDLCADRLRLGDRCN